MVLFDLTSQWESIHRRFGCKLILGPQTDALTDSPYRLLKNTGRKTNRFLVSIFTHAYKRYLVLLIWHRRLSEGPNQSVKRGNTHALDFQRETFAHK
ncbi:hypothetical protein C0J52_17795 [Blattella germanica]|nr:hypothetical protein C0J52_17795 [Blattella germanica]